MFRGNFCFAYVPVFLVLELSTYFISHVIELSVFSHKATYVLAVYAQEVVDALLGDEHVHAR